VAAAGPGRRGQVRVEIDELGAGNVPLLEQIRTGAGGQLPADVKDRRRRIGRDQRRQLVDGDEGRVHPPLCSAAERTRYAPAGLGTAAT
jgi:hypothetical protein